MTPVHDNAAEQIVLGSMMTDPSKIEEVTQRMTGADFYNAKHSTIFDAIVKSHADGEPTDPVALAHRLIAAGDLERIGGGPYLFDLKAAVPTIGMVSHYVGIVVERAFTRRACEAATRVHQAAKTGNAEAVAAALGKVAELAASPGVTSTGRAVRLTSAASIKPRPVRWAWDSRVPTGAVTLIPGREGIGKSLTLAWMTARVTRGELPGVHFGVPRAVVYAATEDSWERTIVPRLIAAGANLELVYRVDVVTDAHTVDALSLPRDCRELEAEIRRLEVALLCVDPLMSVIAAGIDTHRDRELRTALEPLGNLADRTSCAVVGLAHFNKSGGTDPLNLVSGSRAFTAVIRAAIGVARDPDADDGSCVLTQIKNNLGKLDLPSLRYVVDEVHVPTDEGPASVGLLRFTGDSERSVYDILRDGDGDGEQRGERDEAVEWLRGWLIDQGGEAAAGDVLKAAEKDGIARRTLQRARPRAGVRSERRGFGQGSIWLIDVSAPYSRHSRQGPGAGATGANDGANGERSALAAGMHGDHDGDPDHPEGSEGSAS